MRRVSLIRSLQLVLLVAACGNSVAQSIAPVPPLQCVGACGETIFDPSTAQVCDRVDVNVTGTTAGPLVGGDIYDAATTDLGAAAVHAGLVAAGESKVIAAFWAGPRSAFYAVTRNGLTSHASTTDSNGILLTVDTSACPTFSATATPVQNVVAAWPSSGPTAVGATYYATANTTVNAALIVSNIVDEGTTFTGTLYLHAIANHAPFYTVTMRGRTTTASDASAEAFSVSKLAETPAYDPQRTRVQWDGSSEGGVTGWGLYMWNSSLNAAIAHSGRWPLNRPATVEVLHHRDQEFFLSATQYGVESFGAYTPGILQAAFAVADAFDRYDLPPTSTTTVGPIACEVDVLSPRLTGATFYKYDSDLNDAVFQSEVAQVNTLTRVVVHHIGLRSAFYGNDFRGIASEGYSGPAVPAVFVSASEVPPTAAELKTVKVRMTRKSEGSCVGHGYYSARSNLALVAFHSGLVRPGETASLMVHSVGVKNVFYSSSYRGVACGGSAEAAEAVMLYSSAPAPVPYSGTGVYAVNVTATRVNCDNMWGFHAYTVWSDVTCIAQQQGLLKLGETKEVYVHNVGTQSVFRAMRLRGCTSKSHVGVAPAIMVTEDPTVPPTPPDLATTPFAFTIYADDLTTSEAYGAGVYHHASDLKRAAMAEGLITLGETGSIWVVPVTTSPPEFVGNCFGSVLCTDAFHGPSDAPFVLSFDGSNPQAGLPSTTIKTTLFYHNGLNSGDIYGYRETGYLNEGPVSKIAWHTGIIEPNEATTVYVHFLNRCAMHYSGFARGYTSRGSDRDGYVIKTTLDDSAPSPVDCEVRQYEACYKLAAEEYGVVGTTVFHYESEIHGSAFHDFQLNYGECRTLYLHHVGNYTRFYGVKARDARSRYAFIAPGALAGAFMITSSASPSPTVPDAKAVPLKMTLQHLDHEDLQVEGLGEYRAASELAAAAFLEGLLPLGQAKPMTLYAHDVGLRDAFYGGTSRSLTTRGWWRYKPAYWDEPTTCGGGAVSGGSDVLAPVEKEVMKEAVLLDPKANVQCPIADDGGGVIIKKDRAAKTLGRRGRAQLSDLRESTDMILMPGREASACGCGPSPTGIVPDALSQSAAYPADTAVILTASLSPAPTVTPHVTTVKLVYSEAPMLNYDGDSNQQAPGNPRLVGFGPFQYTSDVLLAAIYEGLIGPGETKTVYLHSTPALPWYGIGSNHLVLSESWHEGGNVSVGFQVKATSAFTPYDATGPQKVTITASSMYDVRDMYGAGYHPIDTNVVAAAYQAGLLQIGVESAFYVRFVGLVDRFYGAYARNIYSYSDENYRGLTAFQLLPSLAHAATPFDQNHFPVSVVADRMPYWCPTQGAGYFDFWYAPVSCAALREGLVELGGPVTTVYVHYIGMWPVRYSAQFSDSSFGRVGDNEAFAVTATADAPTVVPGVTPMLVTAAWVRQSTSIAGTYVYSASETNIDIAVVHAGLMSWGESKRIYVHDIGMIDRFFGSTSGGLSSYHSYGPGGWGDRGFIMTLTPDTPELPTATSQPVILWPTFSAMYGPIVGTGRYRPDGDVTAMAYHMGLFDESTPLPIKLYVHRTESGSNSFVPSTHRGVGSNWDNWGGPAPVKRQFSSESWGEAIIVSPSADPPPACMTDPTYVYAVVHGQNERGWAFADDSLSAYHESSDVSVAAVFQGLVAPGQSKIVRIDFTSTSGTYSTATQNGVASDNYWDGAVEGFTITEDASCSFPFRALGAAAAVPAATTCEDDCYTVSGFDTAPIVGTAFQLTIRGSVRDNQGSISGAGVYRADQDWRALVVHAGVVKHGEVKTIWAFYMGDRSAFYSSLGDNVLSSYDFSGPAAAVAFATTNTPPPLSPTVTKVLLGPGHVDWDWVYGTSYYSADSLLNAAARHAGLMNTFSPPQTFYVHHYDNAANDDWPFYVSVPPIATYTEFGWESESSAFKITTAASPVPAPPSPTSNEVTLRCPWWQQNFNLFGHGYSTRASDLCSVAIHHGHYTPSMTSLTIWVHEVGTRDFFLPAGGPFGPMARSSWSTTEATHMTPSSKAPSLAPDVLPVRLDYAGFATGYVTCWWEWNEVYGTPGAYSVWDSELVVTAVHQGLLKPGGTWAGYALLDAETKDHLYGSHGYGDVLSHAYSWYGDVTMALSVDSKLADPPVGTDIVKLELPPTPPYLHPDAKVSGVPGVYDSESDFTAAATHAGLVSPSKGAVLYARVDRNPTAEYAFLPALTSFGVAGKQTWEEFRVVLSTKPDAFESYFAKDEPTVLVTLNLQSPFTLRDPRTERFDDEMPAHAIGFGRYLYWSSINSAAFQRELCDVGVPSKFYVHYSDEWSAVSALPGNIARGVRTRGTSRVMLSYTFFMSLDEDRYLPNNGDIVSESKSDTKSNTKRRSAEAAAVGIAGALVYMKVAFPDTGFHFCSVDGGAGTNWYHYDTPIVCAAAHSGALPREGGKAMDIAAVLFDQGLPFIGSSQRGVRMLGGAMNYAFYPADAHRDLKFAIGGEFETFDLVCTPGARRLTGSVHYSVQHTDLCMAAVHEGLLDPRKFGSDSPPTQIFLYWTLATYHPSSYRHGIVSDGHAGGNYFVSYYINLKGDTPKWTPERAYPIKDAWAADSGMAVHGVNYYHGASDLGLAAFLNELVNFNEGIPALWVIPQQSRTDYFPGKGHAGVRSTPWAYWSADDADADWDAEVAYGDVKTKLGSLDFTAASRVASAQDAAAKDGAHADNDDAARRVASAQQSSMPAALKISFKEDKEDDWDGYTHTFWARPAVFGDVYGNDFFNYNSDMSAAAFFAGKVSYGETKKVFSVQSYWGWHFYRMRVGPNTTKYSYWDDDAPDYDSFCFYEKDPRSNPWDWLDCPYHDYADAAAVGGASEFTFDDVYGTGFYGVDSVATDAAIHAGLIEVGSTDDIYLCYNDKQYDLFATDARGITSKYTDADHTFYPAREDLCGGTINAQDLFPMELEVDLGAIARGGVVTGTTYYSAATTLNLAAYHMGLANPGDTVEVYPLTVGYGLPLLSSSRSFLSSNASSAVQNTNIYLSLDGEVPPCTLHDTGFIATVFPSTAGTEDLPVEDGPEPFTYWNSTAISAASVESGMLRRQESFGRGTINVTLSGTPDPFCDEVSVIVNPGTKKDMVIAPLLQLAGRSAFAQAHGVEPREPIVCRERQYYQPSDNGGSSSVGSSSAVAALIALNSPRRVEAQLALGSSGGSSGSSSGSSGSTPVEFLGFYGLSPSTCIPTRTRSASQVPEPTITKSTSASIDAPTPAPPTPAPYTPEPPATPVPPTTPPAPILHAVTTVEPCGATPIRPASCFLASATYSLEGATPVSGASSPVGFVVVFDAPAGAVIPAAATLPAGCTRNPSGRRATCTHDAHFTNETLEIPFVTEAYPSGAPQVTVSVSVTNWTPSSAVEAAFFAAPTPSPAIPFTIPSVYSGHSPATYKPVVTSTAPAMNALSYGATVTLRGSRLDLLPELLPVGPQLAHVTAAADGLTATIQVVSTAGAYRRSNSIATEASMTAELTSYVAAHASAMYDSLVDGLDGLAAEYYVSEALTAGSLAALTSVRNETAAGQPMDLTRFNIDFATGQITLNPRVPSTFTPVPGAPTPTYTTSTPRPVRPGTNGSIVPVFIPATFFEPMPTSNSSDPNVTVLVLRPDVIITLHVDGDPTTTYHPFPNTPITVHVAMGGGGGGDDNTPTGYWIDIPTNLPLPPLQNVSLVADPTDPTAVILTGGNPTVTIVVVIEDPKAHTQITFNVEYTLVTYSVRLRPMTPYQAEVTVRLASGPSLDQPTVLAYTDAVASVRAYPTRSSDASCWFNSGNVSTHCNVSSIVPAAAAARRQDLVAVGSWGFTLTSSPPSYVTSDMIVRLHITTSNADWKTLTIRLSKDASTLGVVVSAPVSGPSTSPDGTTQAPPAVPTPPTTASPVADLVDPTTEPSFGSAVSRGIFSLVEGGCRPALNILSFTLFVYVLVLMGRGVHTVWMRRRASEPEDRIVTYGVPAWRSLLTNHVYAGVIVPCHHYCGPIHTTQFLVHILSLYTLCSALLASYHDVVTSSSGSYFSIALVCVIGAAVMQPIFNFPYTLYALVDRRTLRAKESSNYGPQDLTSFGTWRQEFVGVTAATVKTSSEIGYVEDGAEDLAAMRRFQAQYTEQAGGQRSRSQRKAPKSCEGDDSEGDEPTDTTIASLPTLAAHTSASKDTNSHELSDSCGSANADDSLDGVIETDVPEGRSCGRRDPRTCVIVNANMYVLAGHVLNGLAAFGFAVSTASNTGAWCTAEFEQFYALFGAAVLLDLVALQPLLLALTWAWRWLVDEGPSSSEEGEEDALIVHELHPIHGQWRFEGPLLEADELAFDDDLNHTQEKKQQQDSLHVSSDSTDYPQDVDPSNESDQQTTAADL
jgi:hypothetical protein